MIIKIYIYMLFFSIMLYNIKISKNNETFELPLYKNTYGSLKSIVYSTNIPTNIPTNF